ncbi:hypothetical protein IHN32_14675, partial [Deinococcus sp. 14RED07]|nr:hypothetical protein [Deinococcus sp. 14RED07]
PAVAMLGERATPEAAARLSAVQGAFHPALMDSRPLLTLAAPEFRMVFPVPRVVRADGRPA